MPYWCWMNINRPTYGHEATMMVNGLLFSCSVIEVWKIFWKRQDIVGLVSLDTYKKKIPHHSPACFCFIFQLIATECVVSFLCWIFSQCLFLGKMKQLYYYFLSLWANLWYCWTSSQYRIFAIHFWRHLWFLKHIRNADIHSALSDCYFCLL